MRILLAAKHAPHGSRPIGGVQTWCRTVCRELERRGHYVETWGPEQPVPLGGFDLGIISNTGDTKRAFAYCQKQIIVSHGIIPAENPFGVEHSDPIVYTSEEIRDHWGVDGIIVRQPIDTEFWSPKKQGAKYLTRFSYRAGLRFVHNIAKTRGLEYSHIRHASHSIAREIVQKSACVLATGRAALEAMSCNIPVVICDHRASYQRPLLDIDIEHAMTRNYSGRGGVLPTVTNVNEAINAAMGKTDWRDHVLKNHSVETVVDKLLGAM